MAGAGGEGKGDGEGEGEGVGGERGGWSGRRGGGICGGAASPRGLAAVGRRGSEEEEGLSRVTSRGRCDGAGGQSE